MIRGNTTAGVSCAQRAEIEFRHDIHDEVSKMIARQPIVQTRRHQKQRLTINLPKVLAHPPSIPKSERKSDSLLAREENRRDQLAGVEGVFDQFQAGCGVNDDLDVP